MDAAFAEQRSLLAQVLSRLEKVQPADETDQIAVLATSIQEKARKRTERTESDRKQAARMDATKRRIVNSISSSHP